VVAVCATLLILSAVFAASAAASDAGGATGRAGLAAEPVDSRQPVVLPYTNWVTKREAGIEFVGNREGG
jgi:hypothetical protein